MKIAVIALGKIGLPLATQFASKGHEVVGVDVNPELVAVINEGRAPFPGEADLDERLADVVARGSLRATTDYGDAIPGADAVVIVVPLLVDAEARPDFAWMDDATRSIAQHLTPGTFVSYETTLPVGTTRSRWLPMLESGSGLTHGDDFALAFSPERVLMGRIFADLRKYPKLVGGIDEASTRRAVAFYEAVLDFDDRDDLPRPNGVWDLGTSEASEMAKLAETTYRDVNIGLANQFAVFAGDHGIDIRGVIEASNSQPFSHIHVPGIAVGGHCIPVYPKLYLWNDPQATIVQAAREANAAMPSYAVGVLEGAHGGLEGQRVVVLGASFRGNVKETALSGVFPVVAALESLGAFVTVHDPYYSDDELVALGFAPHAMGQPADAIILQADHRDYAELRPTHFPGVRTLLDGRRFLNPDDWAGVSYRAIGAPAR